MRWTQSATIGNGDYDQHHSDQQQWQEIIGEMDRMEMVLRENAMCA